jgi:hypothetical protein
MPRPENPITWEGPVADLARALRHAREQAGLPTYRTLAESTHYSASVLADAAAGRDCPTWEVTRAFTAACGASEAMLEPLWSKASKAARKNRSPGHRQRERTRPPGLGPERVRVPEGRVLLPGEPSPHRAATAAQFVHQLRALRVWAGQPGWKEIFSRSRKHGYYRLSKTGMYDALNPARTSLPPLEAVQAIAHACASPGAAEDWGTVWKAIRLREFEQANPMPEGPPVPAGQPSVQATASGRPPRLRVVGDR